MRVDGESVRSRSPRGPTRPSRASGVGNASAWPNDNALSITGKRRRVPDRRDRRLRCPVRRSSEDHAIRLKRGASGRADDDLARAGRPRFARPVVGRVPRSARGDVPPPRWRWGCRTPLRSGVKAGVRVVNGSGSQTGGSASGARSVVRGRLRQGCFEWLLWRIGRPSTTRTSIADSAEDQNETPLLSRHGQSLHQAER